MFKNNLKIAFRLFMYNKGYSLLNIFGLSIGIAVSIVGFLYVFSEFSHDRFNKNADRIHRIAVEALIGTSEIHMAQTSAAYADALYNDFPEIDKITRIKDNEFTFEYQDKKFVENNVFVVDSTFFDIFTIPVIQGKTSNLLNEPYMAVLTKSAAERYFGDNNPVNQIIREGETNFKVIAVVEDVPKNSHFHFDIAVSIVSFDRYYVNPHWFNNNVRTYIMLHKNVDYKKVEARFPEFVNNYLYNGRYSANTAKGNKWELYLQPLTSIHLNSDLRGEFEANGRKEYIYIFLIVTVFILLIACINFINLSTAKATKRAKEVGVCKVLGAEKKQLIRQFLLESVFFSFISLIIAMMLVELFKPFLNQLINKSLIIDYTDPIFIMVLIGLILFTGLLGGAYPAVVMSSFRPIVVLKGNSQRGGKFLWLRNVLVIFQFLISVVVIIGTLVISIQLNFMQNKNLGFDKEKVIVIKNVNTIGGSIQAIKNEIENLSFVQHVAYSDRLPGRTLAGRGFRVEGEKDGFAINALFTDENLADVLKLKLSKGRFFSNEYGTDTMAIVINKETEKLLGFEDPLGKRLIMEGPTLSYFHIIGVVENFHYESKHQKIHPMAFMAIGAPLSERGYYLSVRVVSDNYTKMIAELSNIWENYSPGVSIDYTFLDEQYDSLYKNEMQTKKLFLAFSFLTIFIACLGLLGLASYMIQQKTREIGIRKTFGASATTIIWLLSKGFAKWIIIANIIAWPLAWYLFDNWLNNFAERCPLSWWYFALATIISLLIAWITIAYQTIKASKANPIDELRHE
ncbi:MAG: ABC transporter permease [Bacteroidetes bacterium]|nr:ABC transporter permease [Bacteroidota bacterium]